MVSHAVGHLRVLELLDPLVLGKEVAEHLVDTTVHNLVDILVNVLGLLASDLVLDLTHSHAVGADTNLDTSDDLDRQRLVIGVLNEHLTVDIKTTSVVSDFLVTNIHDGHELSRCFLIGTHTTLTNIVQRLRVLEASTMKTIGHHIEESVVILRLVSIGVLGRRKTGHLFGGVRLAPVAHEFTGGRGRNVSVYSNHRVTPYQ